MKKLKLLADRMRSNLRRPTDHLVHRDDSTFLPKNCDSDKKQKQSDAKYCGHEIMNQEIVWEIELEILMFSLPH